MSTQTPKYFTLVCTISLLLQTAPSYLYAGSLQSSDAIAGGAYLTSSNDTRALLARSHDGGSSWFYPSTIESGLPTDAGPIAFFQNASCSRLNCLASGSYIRILNPNNSANYPLLAASSDNGDTWNYPSTIISRLPTHFNTGEFSAPAVCSDLNCVAAGDYFNNNNTQFPLLANSQDGGATWSYPDTIISNLPTDFIDKGEFLGANSVAKSFVAAGRYLNVNDVFNPLLAASQDGGITWNYPESILSNLPNDFKNSGIFNSVTCSFSTCIAAGKYMSSNTGQPFFALVAVSHDQGQTWFYPTTTVTHLPTNFSSLLAINQVSCNGKYCIIAGQYQGISGTKYPLLLQSSDTGNTWFSPPTIFSGLPDDFESTGTFNGAHCNRNICLAVGQYQSTVRNNQLVPLIASSLDGGKTWVYPATALSNFPTNLLNGELSGVYCNVDDCNAEGQYQATNSVFYPLIANSHDAGKSWTYPTSVVANLPFDFANNGMLVGGNSSFTLKKNLSKK